MNLKCNALADTLCKVALMILLPGMLAAFTKNAVASAEEISSVQISANSITLESAKRRVVYSGKVRLRHKSLTITGSKAVAISRNTGNSEVTISGNPVVANFVDARGKSVHLTSQSLAYDSATRSLVAIGNVKLKSGLDILTGQEMQYDMANDNFSIKGNHDAPRISAVINIGKDTPH